MSDWIDVKGFEGIYKINKKGDNHYKNKYSFKQICEMRNLFKEGMSRKDISKKFNIEYTYACHLISKTCRADA